MPGEQMFSFDITDIFPSLKNRPPLDLDRLYTDGALFKRNGETYLGHRPRPDLRNPYNIIKINSTFLEMADNHYFSRGAVLLIFGLMFFLFGVFAILMSAHMWLRQEFDFPTLLLSGVSVLLAAPIDLIGAWVIKADCFNLTHNPVRFNRKNKMVYAVLYDKQIVAAPWDKVVFVAGGGQYSACIDGYITEDDGATVLHNFTIGLLMFTGVQTAELWEFIRCYMGEEKSVGLEQIVDKVDLCLPIAEHRESMALMLRLLLLVP